MKHCVFKVIHTFGIEYDFHKEVCDKLDEIVDGGGIIVSTMPIPDPKSGNRFYDILIIWKQ